MPSIRFILFALLVAGLGLFNRYMTRTLPLEEQNLDGKVYIVTGASSGIGVETTRYLVDWGATVVLACRNTKKAQVVLDDIATSTGKKDAMYNMELDLSSLKSVRNFASKFQQMGLPLHGLINNAGMVGLESLRYTEDNIELSFQTNHVGHFLLTDLLLDNLKQSAPSRIVHVSSLAHFGPMSIDDLPLLNTTYGMAQYGRTKLCNVLFSNELNRRLVAEGYNNVVSHSLHPGSINTDASREGHPILRKLLSLAADTFMRSMQDGAKTTIHAATHPSLTTVGGLYFDACEAVKPSADAQNLELAKALWQWSEEMVGIGAPVAVSPPAPAAAVVEEKQPKKQEDKKVEL